MMNFIKLFVIFWLQTLNKILSVYCSVDRSFGGRHIDITEVPYVVLLLIHIDDKWKKDGKCTGSIIAENWVLTAAHCAPLKNPNKYTIIAGIDDMDADNEFQQKRKPLELIVHPRYYANSASKWDFALMKVKKFDLTTDNVGIIPLGDDIWPQDAMMYNRKCLSVGWGIPSKDMIDNRLLHATDVLAEHGETACRCLKSYQKKRAVCIKRQAHKGICMGDSGGPLVCNGKAYGVAHILYDVTVCSFFQVTKKSECGSSTSVGVYMYTCPELQWIRKHVKTTPGRPYSCHANIQVDKSNKLIIFCVIISLKNMGIVQSEII